MKKNNFKSLAAVLSLAMAATAVPVNVNAAAAPKITVSKKTVYSGKTYSATVKNLKKGYTVQFSSTDGGVNFKTKKVKATGAKVTAKFTVKAAKNIADNATTKIKAVVKNANGKKVKTVNQKITLKQLANSITLKDLQATTVKVGETVNADATISPAAAKGAYKKTFTSDNSSVLKVTNASNGLFEAVAPGTATISVTAVNDKGKVVAGTKTITVTVEAAEDNKPDVPSIDPENPDNTTGGSITTGPAITTEYQLSLTAGKSTITSDSRDNTEIGVLLKAPTGVTPNENMTVAVQLALDTKGIGSLSPTDTTLRWDAAKQGWYNVVRFTSATLTTATTSKVTAAVYSVVNGPEGVNLVGISAQPIQLTLNPYQTTVEENVAAQAVKAVVEDLDRITITFNKAVDRKYFLLDDKSGLVANGTNSQDVTGKDKTPTYFQMYIKDAVPETDNSYPNANNMNGVDITHKDVVDVVRVNDYTLTFVLRNKGDNTTKGKGMFGDATGAHFTDNSKFLVTFIDQHASTSVEGRCTEHISDITVPSVMNVKENDMKSIIVTFDQPVYSTEESEIGTTEVNKAAIISALNKANFTIDGKNLWNNGYAQAIPNSDRSYFGDPKTIKIELTDKTARNEVKITLGKDGDKQCYFTTGAHVLQVSNVGDYAAITETGTNNRITTKNFDFTIGANTVEPSITVVAQSAEQYKVTFNCNVEQLEGVAVGQEIPASKIGLSLMFRDTNVVSAGSNSESLKVAMTDWADACGAWRGYSNGSYRGGLGQELKVTRIQDDANKNPQVKVEVTHDWTTLENYKAPNHKNHFNYSFAIRIGDKALRNAANGKENPVITRPLTDACITNIDVTTPVINDIIEIVSEKEYEVTFSEPIQADNPELANPLNNYYAHAYTPAVNSTKIGTMTAEFVNNTTKQSYAGMITGYGENFEDTSVRVRPSMELPKGYEYTLIIRGVSDDIGNTSNTLSKTFRTADAAKSQFKILSVLADANYNSKRTPSDATVSGTDWAGVYELDQVYQDTAGANPDVIYVEFSGQYAAAPILDSVLNVANWNINGAALPVGSTIYNGIRGAKQGTDGKDVLVDRLLSDAGHSGVTIYLPHGSTMTNVNSTLVKVGSNVKDINNNQIAANTTFTTQSIFKDSIFNGTGDVKSDSGIINGSATTTENK